jgi:hypothetical protein
VFDEEPGKHEIGLGPWLFLAAVVAVAALVLWMALG